MGRKRHQTAIIGVERRLVHDGMLGYSLRGGLKCGGGNRCSEFFCPLWVCWSAGCFGSALRLGQLHNPLKGRNPTPPARRQSLWVPGTSSAAETRGAL